MTLVMVVRHGLTASTGKALTGWMPGISLDERGRAQATALGSRLAKVPLAAIVSSPLDRCQETAAAIAARQDRSGPESMPESEPGSEPRHGPDRAWGPDPEANGSAPLTRAQVAQVELDDRLGECKYGDWTGQSLRRLAHDPLWKVVQAHPSAVRFPGPGGESMLEMQQRAVTAVRDWNDKLGKDATYLICSHGDVIKAILADALGMHLDMSQRIQIDPCSLSVIRYTTLRPFVLRMNDTGSDSGGLARRPAQAKAGAEADAQIGGGAGDMP